MIRQVLAPNCRGAASFFRDVSERPFCSLFCSDHKHHSGLTLQLQSTGDAGASSQCLQKPPNDVFKITTHQEYKKMGRFLSESQISGVSASKQGLRNKQLPCQILQFIAGETEEGENSAQVSQQALRGPRCWRPLTGMGGLFAHPSSLLPLMSPGLGTGSSTFLVPPMLPASFAATPSLSLRGGMQVLWALPSNLPGSQ